jgi:hypothetical protein
MSRKDIGEYIRYLKGKLGEKDEDIRILRMQITHLRAVMEETLPRYAELYEKSGMGHPNDSIVVQEMRRALDMTKQSDRRGYGQQRQISEAITAALENLKTP